MIEAEQLQRRYGNRRCYLPDSQAALFDHETAELPVWFMSSKVLRRLLEIEYRDEIRSLGVTDKYGTCVDHSVPECDGDDCID